MPAARNVLLDLVAIALDHASRDHQLACFTGHLVLRHLQNGVDGFLLGGINKGAGIHHDHVGIFGVRSDLRAAALENAHHDFAIHQIFRTPQAHKADFDRLRHGPGSLGRQRYCGRFNSHA